MPHPVLAMPMWEGAGNRALDLSGHGNHAQFYNEAYWTAEGVGFDGTNDYIQATHSSSIDFADEDFAVSMWFNTTTVAVVSYMFSKNYGGVGVKWYGVNIDPGIPQIACFVDDGANTSSLITTDDFNDGAWHHLVFTRDTTANLIRAYIDGAWNADGNDISGSIANTGTLTIGGRNDLDAARFFDGSIRLFTIFDFAPTERQVKFLYDNPYFMYRLPEELYGYTAPGARTAKLTRSTMNVHPGVMFQTLTGGHGY